MSEATAHLEYDMNLIFSTLIISYSFCLTHWQDNSFKQENKPENLRLLCEKLQQAKARQDKATLNALGAGLVPDETKLKQGLKENVAPADHKAILQFHAGFKAAAGNDMGKLFTMKPEQTTVQVHGATTEELAAYVKESNAWKHFPGGCQGIAARVLKPGMTYYVVEFLKPGESAGMKFHLFYWDGSQWSMLGPLWRAFR